MRERNQPPQRRVDAAQIPEVGLLLLEVDELGDLSVGGLMHRERMQASCSLALESLVAGQCHADCADRGIASENGVIAALDRPGTGRRREDAGGRHVAFQQLDGAPAAFLEQRRSAARPANRASRAHPVFSGSARRGRRPRVSL